MRYVLLIYGSEIEYGKLPEEKRKSLMEAHAPLADDMLKRNILIGGGPLQPTSTAVTVRMRKGRKMTTDGPFAETKEQLAGFYVVDCNNLDEAIALAARIPDVEVGSIEIRPVIEF